MILIIEVVVLLVIISVADIIGLKNGSLQGLHNLPVNIQKRVRELPEYKDRIKEPILSKRERIIRKIPALIAVTVIFALLTYLAGARDFIHGFLYSYILSCSIKLYVTLILQCVVLVNHRNLWLPGTEDLADDWRDRRFYMSSIPRSLFAFAMVSLLIGMIIALISVMPVRV